MPSPPPGGPGACRRSGRPVGGQEAVDEGVGVARAAEWRTGELGVTAPPFSGSRESTPFQKNDTRQPVRRRASEGSAVARPLLPGYKLGRDSKGGSHESTLSHRPARPRIVPA